MTQNALERFSSALTVSPLPTRPSAIRRYIVAIATVAAALLVTLLLSPLFERSDLALFMIAVMIGTWYGGLGPGLLATGLSALAYALLLMPPHYSVAIATREDLLRLGAYLAAGFVTSSVTAAGQRAEAGMREQWDLCRVTLTSIGDAVIVTDTTGRVTFMNDVSQALTGWSRVEAIGKPLTEVFSIVNEMTRHPVENPVSRIVREGMVIGLANHTVLMARDGTERPIDDSGAPVRDRTGTVVGVVLVFRDVTERKRAEQEREQLLVREQAARAQAEAANRAKDEFLATVSHELRTPLTAVLGWIRLLRTAPLDAPMSARALETIERNAKAQARLMDDLLDVSRIITGRLRLDVRPVDLVSVIDAVLDTVRPAATAKGIRLRAVLDPAAGPVLGDAARLQQVVWNIVSNAIKFTPPDGSVEVKLERAESTVSIRVQDSGQGIARDFLPYVFDRFSQQDPSFTRRHGGLGLGLAIVRHLVELHGGRVQVESEGEGQGAVFTATLPLRPLHMEAREPLEPAAAGGEPAKRLPSLDGARVLVVEDDADTRVLVAAVLERCQADVTTVASVEAALDALNRVPIDVVVSDIALPGEDGYALIHKVRALPPERGGRLPAAALTAYATEADRARILAAGFQAHLTKPIEPAELAAVVARLAGRTTSTE
ncbi:MAG: ATP-binding protein [Candidatus Rokuibacteriota bacterium]